jgi:hypothetical protein
MDGQDGQDASCIRTHAGAGGEFAFLGVYSRIALLPLPREWRRGDVGSERGRCKGGVGVESNHPNGMG